MENSSVGKKGLTNTFLNVGWNSAGKGLEAEAYSPGIYSSLCFLGQLDYQGVALIRNWIRLQRAFRKSMNLLATGLECAPAEAGALEALVVRSVLNFNPPVRAFD